MFFFSKMQVISIMCWRRCTHGVRFDLMNVQFWDEMTKYNFISQIEFDIMKLKWEMK